MRCSCITTDGARGIRLAADGGVLRSTADTRTLRVAFAMSAAMDGTVQLNRSKGTDHEESSE
jgi:hypothetical protein